MFFFHSPEGININNQVKLTLTHFKLLEPHYSELPSGYENLYYEQGKNYYISGPNRQTIQKPAEWEDGNRYIERIDEFKKLQEYIEQKENEILNNVNEELQKRKPYDEKRKSEYPSIETLVVALWENIVEKKTKQKSGIMELQKIREQIKEKYPKPNPEQDK
jgi:hypothetical protein